MTKEDDSELSPVGGPEQSSLAPADTSVAAAASSTPEEEPAAHPAPITAPLHPSHETATDHAADEGFSPPPALFTPPPATSATHPTSLRQCAACLEYHPAGLTTCPHCGTQASGEGLTPTTESLLQLFTARPYLLALVGAFIIGTFGFVIWMATSDTLTNTVASLSGGCDPACEEWHECREGRCARTSFASEASRLQLSQSLEVGPRARALQAHETRLYVASSRGVEVLDARSLQRVTEVPARGARYLSVIDDNLYASGQRQVTVISLGDARFLKNIPLRNTRPAAPSQDRSRVYFPQPSNRSVAIVDPAHHHAVIHTMNFPEAIATVVTSPQLRRGIALTGRERGRRGRSRRRGRSSGTGSALYSFDPGSTDSQSSATRIDAGAQPWHAHFVSDDRAWVSLRGDNALVEIQWQDERVILGERRHTCEKPETIIASNADPNVFLVRCENAFEVVMPGLEQPRMYPVPNGMTDLSLSSDGQIVFILQGSGNNHELMVWDLSADMHASYPLTTRPIDVEVNETDGRVYVLSPRYLQVFE